MIKFLAHISEETTTSVQPQLPFFNVGVQRNLTVTVGQTGFLHCKVEQLGDKDVSKHFCCNNQNLITSVFILNKRKYMIEIFLN